MFGFKDSRLLRGAALAATVALAAGAIALPFHADAAAKRAAGEPAACPMADGGPAGFHHEGRDGHEGPGGPIGGPLPGRLLRDAGASDEQIARIRTIFESRRAAAEADRDKLRGLHDKTRELLAAPTVDRAELDKLRSEQLALADAESRRMTGALADAAEVLTPAQRAKIATLLADRREHDGHGHHDRRDDRGPRDGARPGPDNRPPTPDQPPTS
ncbi:Spy/CpxP family protein refolding chaperone [Derxia lacustris]|uniref:Spy/CpxP family protein refolding chaperone n=1 Tax=Derxia lacustris TaxID=764842 RepID=UPI000A173D81|nr:Spy/CpxP family protein refolding chaperone [Derxia lacustris]